MNYKKLILILPIFFSCIACSGCTSFLFRKNAPVTDQSQTTETAEIISVTEPGEGILEDVNDSGDAMLVFSKSQAPPITYNIEIFQKNKSGKWAGMNFLNSEKPHLSGIFSSNGDGIFYTETINRGDSDNTVSQLMWMSLDRKTTRVLSQEYENIITDLYRLHDGNVLCVNDQHQILMIDSSGNRISRNINADYMIQDLAYDRKNQKLFFTGNTDNSDILNLYSVDLNEHDLMPSQIDINILSFDFNIIDNKLLYRRNNGSQSQLVLYNCKSNQKNVMLDTIVNEAVLNEDASAIIYSIPVTQNDPRLQIIQIMDIDTKKIRQITSPRFLSSLLYSRNHALFSSVINENKNSDNLYDSKIFTLEYQ